MKIAVDAMGGDHAPGEVVKGAVIGAREHSVDIILVGPEQIVKQEIAKHDITGVNIEIIPASEYLVEGEHPAYALRNKRDASVIVATKLVKAGRADAVASAGPTGGVVAAALMILGCIEGIARPVIGGQFLGFSPKTVVMDLGGNVDCLPEQLLDFAIVGTVYAEKLLGIENPTVALLSIGAEEGKGNERVRESYDLFKKSGLNFIGNVEGYDIPLGRANVVICDGFVGNILVKYSEALGEKISDFIENQLEGKLPQVEIKELCKSLQSATNAADMMGGGPIWAVDGVAVVMHGRSKSIEVAAAIGRAKSVVEMDLLGTLKNEIAAARKKIQ
ncbi:phosphate acyltransferase PlsX [Chloroflexota bacterium]